MRFLQNRTTSRRDRRGLGLVEVVVATLLVSTVLLGAMNLLGAVTRDRASTAERARGDVMAQQLMAEIMATNYVDSDLLPLFGPELLEVTGNRSAFDDVDDYNGWTASPPKTRAGASLPGTSGWRHTVAVELVNRNNPTAVSLLDQGIKRITVRIERGGRTISKLVALRSNKY